MSDATDSRQRDFFAASAVADQTELKAHAALYAAREAASSPAAPEPEVVTARPRVIRQGGAAAVRTVRERLVAEHRAVVVEAGPRFGGGIPKSSILKIRLSDLPKLLQPGRDTDRLT
ncbi:MAG: hypothetical protein JNK84_00465 [Phreatobacter sp.]|uniref:hypothetical protein n=1 Tax=Phreatobacter sp. TaxID=1966341 RepID=UPI001A571053|nr:hypothetical protein [Phreatobacter sp.]MBL8567533.1 hypothetical protein [Phreatobacter sp.]